MKNPILLLGLLLFLIGCSSSLPPAIPEEFLEDKTPEETKKLEETELKIISLPDEKVEALKEVRKTSLQEQITQSRLNQLEAQKKDLESQKKKHESKKEMDQAMAVQTSISALDEDISFERSKLEHLKTAGDAQKAGVDEINAELAALVAKQRLMQAIIGRHNQDKLLGALPEGVKDKNRIDVSLYEAYVKKTEQNLEQAKERQQKMAQKAKQSESAFSGIQAKYEAIKEQREQAKPKDEMKVEAAEMENSPQEPSMQAPEASEGSQAEMQAENTEAKPMSGNEAAPTEQTENANENQAPPQN